MSDVDRRVEALPQVHDDVRLEDGVVAGEAVDLDHGAAGAVGGVVKPPPAVGLGVVVEACLDMLNFNFHIFQEICHSAGLSSVLIRSVTDGQFDSSLVQSHSWGCIEARGEEGNALEVCPPHPVVPALVRHALPVRLQPIPEHCAGVEDGHAVLECQLQS